MNRPDLDSCAQEPIHVPGAIQPHGAMVVIRPSDMTVLQASANATEFLGRPIAIGETVDGVIDAHRNEILTWHGSEEPELQIQADNLSLGFHRAGDMIVAELETSPSDAADNVFLRLRGFAQQLAGQPDLPGALSTTVRVMEKLTGFDRVLAYRFDGEWNGHVVAEAGNGRLPSYMGLRFPAGDIPPQARALYALNHVRLIPDVNYQPVPLQPVINPQTGDTLDMSSAQLRSVSPIHLEYMRNMGTAASMSVSIMVDGRLWGLIACHSHEPHNVPVVTREACDFIVQTLAMRIAAQEHADEAAHSVALARIQGRLLGAMSVSQYWLDGLVSNVADLLAQVAASGAAIVAGGECHTVGATPTQDEIAQIIGWLADRPDTEVFATHALPLDMPAAKDFAATASGIIAIRISELHESWLIWFRPEVLRTVEWGGDPHKVVREQGRIHPRVSFERWSEQVRLHAAPWAEAEITAARDLRAAIVGIVLRKAEELAQLSSELQRSNKELEAFSYSVSHDLRAPFRHIVGFAQLLRERENVLDEKSKHYLQTISEAALSAGRLVDDLLNFSQLGRASIAHKTVDMNKLVAEVVRSVMINNEDRAIEWAIDTLPPAWGDATLLRQVWFNLIENAVKYSRPRAPARISVTGTTENDRTTYTVSDNGVGFDMAYVDKLFGVFQRLQRVEDFEGTGIGLALVRRIIERHSGIIRGEGEVDKGATFVFALPKEGKGKILA
ncbi:light-regulated signal transduction histidine kinase (bacteriophytochrome) [Neorhizobium huautlense]|uniref:histidine kinase n=1 Tax=Neorhizobium huautlense TaxID=67774 RepID=A0ABT9PLZ3_9HYPH|nr:ATP-binding protein [Neorhizobium huautlense]MDP9835482.1 light-regulated signal transduction histidine kinase (bacteriophytochrome) [Neorhizobium huautlense]